VKDGTGIDLIDTDHDVRQAHRAGVRAAAVQTGGQAVRCLHKI